MEENFDILEEEIEEDIENAINFEEKEEDDYIRPHANIKKRPRLF